MGRRRRGGQSSESASLSHHNTPPSAGLHRSVPAPSSPSSGDPNKSEITSLFVLLNLNDASVITAGKVSLICISRLQTSGPPVGLHGRRLAFSLRYSGSSWSSSVHSIAKNIQELFREILLRQESLVGFWNFHRNSAVTDLETPDIPKLRRITRAHWEV